MLQNRFPSEVFEWWTGFYTCLMCGRSHANTLHHIISPTSNSYVKGNHNRSIYNSCPVNNNDCHLYKPLHNFAKEKELLLKVKDVIDRAKYKPNETDNQFLKVYEKYYRTTDTATSDGISHA